MSKMNNIEALEQFGLSWILFEQSVFSSKRRQSVFIHFALYRHSCLNGYHTINVRIFIIRSMSCILYLVTGSMTLAGRHVIQFWVFIVLSPLYRPCLIICSSSCFLYVMWLVFELNQYAIYIIMLKLSVPATCVSNYACYVCSYGLYWH